MSTIEDNVRRVVVSMKNDPTYNMDEIASNPEWKLAFLISEVLNDQAPLGWGNYTSVASVIMRRYKLSEVGGHDEHD